MARKQVVGASLPFERYGRYGWHVTETGSRIDAAWVREMGREWDKPVDPQFAYTGRRKGDKELLASLLHETREAVAA